jgi:hypothetical protein
MPPRVLAYSRGQFADVLSERSAGCVTTARERGMVAALAGTGNCEKYKKSGNEAKKYLKTKDITFLNAANSAHFAPN